MHVALTRLQQGRTTIRELAARSGYASEAAFSRAFKRIIGVSPGAVGQRSEHPGAERAPSERRASTPPPTVPRRLREQRRESNDRTAIAGS